MSELRNWIAKNWGWLLLLATAVSCSRSDPAGPFMVNVVQPTDESCVYEIAPGQLNTLYSLRRMEGELGKVLYQDRELLSDNNTLDSASGFELVDVRFSEKDSIYTPLDYSSMFASSLYWSLEQAHLMFSGVDARSNMVDRLGNTAETIIIHEARARLTEGPEEATDNAAFLGHYFLDDSGSVGLRNYFFSFPTDRTENIPLGINLGVIVHEYSHFVSFHLFQWEVIQKHGPLHRLPTESINTISAVDEGIADYFGYLGSRDARFLQCSLPTTNRNLAQTKVLTAETAQAIRSESDFDPHSVGAVIGAALYEAAQTTGDANGIGQSLVMTLDNLANCAGSNGSSFNYNLTKFKNCHLQNLSGANKDAVEASYARAFGGFF